MTWRENPKLYEVAKQTCHEFGLPWTDPRSGKTYPPPKKAKANVRKTKTRRGKSHRD